VDGVFGEEDRVRGESADPFRRRLEIGSGSQTFQDSKQFKKNDYENDLVQCVSVNA